MSILVLIIVTLLWIALGHMTEDKPLRQATIVCYRADTHQDDCECGLEHDQYCLGMERI